MGASLAYFLTREGAWGAGKKVVVVEGRDVGSGASGRNGGHVGPSTSEAFAMHQLPIGGGGSGVTPEESLKIVQSEIDNLDLITDLINKEKLDVDFWRGHLCEVHETKTSSAEHIADYRAWIDAREEYGIQGDHHTTLITDPVEAQTVSRFNQAYSCQLRPAASVHSHRLCTALMRKALESPHSDCQLYTYAPVSGIEKTSDGKWEVRTAMGDVKAAQVILCTNAYTKHFFNKDNKEEELLHSHIRPAYAQCSLITPPLTYSGSNALQNTYNMDGAFYLVQTPSGGMVLGGWNLPIIKGREKTYQRVGNEDDSGVMPQWTNFLANYCKTRFTNWGEELHGEGATRTWSGLMTDSKDALPLVGEVPGKEGMFLSAGFHGHGQSRIFIIAQGLAETLKTGQWPSRLPVSFKLTKERLERSRHVPEVLDEYSDLTAEEMADVEMQVESMVR
ncbi:hypothetical protein NCC49_004777 [Naganishia albida]|nr:hypothetical protein NCC49_004777 [Naganishia albida]